MAVKRLVPNVPHADLLLFALVSGGLMHYFENEPETLAGFLRSGIARFTQAPERAAAAERVGGCVPGGRGGDASGGRRRGRRVAEGGRARRARKKGEDVKQRRMRSWIGSPILSRTVLLLIRVPPTSKETRALFFPYS
jgi:hypothetical protein